MESNVSVKKVTIESKSFFLIVHEGVKKSEETLGLPVDIILTNCHSFYTGTLVDSNLETGSAICKTDLTQYGRHVHEALIGENHSYFFAMDELKLIVKRKINSSNIMVHLISIEMHSKTEIVLETLLTQVADQIRTQRDRIGELDGECKKLRELYEGTRETLSNFIETKKGWESELYSKFAAVLNEKKKMIESYKDEEAEFNGDERDPVETKHSDSEPSTSGASKPNDLLFEDKFVVKVTRPRKRNTKETLVTSESRNLVPTKRRQTRRRNAIVPEVDADELIDNM